MRFLALALVLATATAANLRVGRDPAEVGKTVDAALTTIQKALAKNKERQGTTADLCAAEQKATKKWMDEGSGIDNKDRLAAKRGMADALEGRIAGLKKFLGKLKNIRKKLRSHIIRVNSAFGTKYLENDNAMQAAKSAVDPQSGLKLLKLPAQDVETEDDKAEMAADDKDDKADKAAAAAPAMFLQLVSSAPKSTISDLATKLYDVALANSQMTRKNIELERSALGTFRDKLRALILKREAKLNKLMKQLADIKKALADGGSFMKDIWPYLLKHYDVTSSSCKMMQVSFAAAEKAEQEVVEAIKTGGSGGGDASVPVTAEAVPPPITF